MRPMLLLIAICGVPLFANWVPVATLVGQADHIVEANAATATLHGREGTVVLTVGTTLKGSLKPGSTVSAHVTMAEESLLPSTELPASLWFFKETGSSGLEVILVDPGRGNLLFHAFYRLAPGPTGHEDIQSPLAVGSADDVALGRIIRRLTDAAIHFQGHYEFGLRIPHLFPAGNPDALAAYRRLEQNPLAAIRVMGLAGLIREGDTRAMEDAAMGTPELARSSGRIGLSRAIDAYRGCDARAVRSLMLWAAQPGPISDSFLNRSAAFAMSESHCQAMMPDFVTLLDHRDAFVRQMAVTGLSAAASGFPIFVDAETRERALRLRVVEWQRRAEVARQEGPAAAALSGDEDFPFHFGMFESEEEEVRVIRDWKAWWSRRLEALGR